MQDRLRFLLRNPERVYRTNSREASDTGQQYTDEAIHAGELVSALGRCTPRQQQALYLWLGRPGRDQEEVAKALGVSTITVKRDVGEAFRRMVDQIWDD